MRTKRTRMVVIGLGVTGASLPLVAASLPGGQVVLWVAGVVLMLAAAIVATRSGRGRGRRGQAPVIAFAVAFAMGVGATHVAVDGGEVGAVPESYALSTRNGPVVSTVAAPRVIEVDDAYKERSAEAWRSAAEALEQVREIDGRLEDALVRAVEASGYEPLSGLSPAYAEAEAFGQGSARFVSVPLVGGNFPEVSRAVFSISGDQVSVTETVAAFLDGATVELEVWTDGVVETHSILHDSTIEEDPSQIVEAGFSIKRFNSCLLNAGIPQWVIVVAGAACGAVCGVTAGIGCPACWAGVAGFGAGAISACFYTSFV